MRAPLRTASIVSTAVVLALSGCSSTSGGVEPGAGELDWDVAVTRAAIQYGAPALDLEYQAWSHQTLDRANDGGTAEVTDELTETGLEALCSYVAIDDGSPIGDWYLSTVLHEAVNGAVFATASDEFRETYALAKPAVFDYAAEANEEELEAHLAAIDLLAGELNAEWVELYELQTELEQEAFTLENAQAAQAATASRCDIDLDDDAVVDEVPDRMGPWILDRPVPASAGSGDDG